MTYEYVVLQDMPAYCAYFVSPVGWTNVVHCYAWDANAGNAKHSGNWPGEACEKIEERADGTIVWKWTYSGYGNHTTPPSHIIFNNNSSPQTQDLTFKDGAWYDNGGILSAVERVNMSGDSVNEVYSIDGRIIHGVKSIEELQRGIYIINRRKVVVL